MVRAIEMREILTVRVRPPRPDEDGADGRVLVQIVGEGFLHGFGVAGEVEAVAGDGGVDEVVDGFEGVFGDNVDRVEGLGEVGRVSVCGGVEACLLGGVGVEGT